MTALRTVSARVGAFLDGLPAEGRAWLFIITLVAVAGGAERIVR